MKMYIPEIGDQFVLTNNWDFDLYSEYRNESLLKKIGIKFSWNDRDKKKYPATMVMGVTLKVDRIYIRKGNSEYSSLTFYVVSGDYKGCRFWAKLSDVNKIEFDEVKVANTLSVKISPNITTAIKDTITSERYSTYHQYAYYPPECRINGIMNVVKVMPITEKRNLTPEEVKTLNSVNKGLGNRIFYGSSRTYTVNDEKILKYELEASLVSTGEVIAKASTTPTLNKKIKEFFTKNPDLIPSK